MGKWCTVTILDGVGKRYSLDVHAATFDALVFRYYEGSKLLYVCRTRNGFTPRVREELLKRFRSRGWAFGIESHWGRHAISAIGGLHSLLFDP